MMVASNVVTKVDQDAATVLLEHAFRNVNPDALRDVSFYDIAKHLCDVRIAASSFPRTIIEPAPDDDDVTRAFVAGWNAREEHSDFDIALHFWMLASVRAVAS